MPSAEYYRISTHISFKEEHINNIEKRYLKSKIQVNQSNKKEASPKINYKKSTNSKSN